MKLLQNLQKKILHSVLIQIRKQVRQSLLVWVSFTLEIIVDRLLREFKVEANVGAPQVAYKETFTKAVDVEYKYAKQSGGRGQYGHCKVQFEPMDPTAKRHSNSILQLSVVLFLRNTSQQLVKVSKKLLKLVSLADSLFLVFTLQYTMDLTMRSTLLKWHSTSLVLWHSKRLCKSSTSLT